MTPNNVEETMKDEFWEGGYGVEYLAFANAATSWTSSWKMSSNVNSEAMREGILPNFAPYVRLRQAYTRTLKRLYTTAWSESRIRLTWWTRDAICRHSRNSVARRARCVPHYRHRVCYAFKHGGWGVPQMISPSWITEGIQLATIKIWVHTW